MERCFEDSVVLVTGDASGIGQATALAFAHAGATVSVLRPGQIRHRPDAGAGWRYDRSINRGPLS